MEQDGKTVLRAAGQGGVDVDPASGAAGGGSCQQQGDDEVRGVHAGPPFRRERRRAVSRPTVTEARELIQTAGRMSKGAALPKAARANGESER